jgi:acetyl-CoA/propionyl-CoA carboxylase biotin carboxyl carrier protein
VRVGDEIADLYDPLVAKLIVHDVDREHARRRMLRALEEFVLEGPLNLLGFHRALLETPCFIAGETCSGVVESEELARRAEELQEQLSHRRTTVAPDSDAAGARGSREQRLTIELDGRRHDVRIHTAEPPWAELARRHQERGKGIGGDSTGAVVSPMQGTVLSVAVSVGGAVSAGELVCVVEAMKMENELVAHRGGVVAELHVAPGQQVALGDVVCVIQEP